MIKDITLGQYYPADSVIHELDPRTKLIGTIIYMIMLFYWQNIGIYLLATLVLALLLLASKIPIKYQLRGLKPVIPIMIFTGILNLCRITNEYCHSHPFDGRFGKYSKTIK